MGISQADLYWRFHGKGGVRATMSWCQRVWVPWQRLGGAGEIRPYVTGAHAHLEHFRYQKTPEGAAVVPSFAPMFPPRRAEARGFLMGEANSSETPDPVYLIDFCPVCHLYKTYRSRVATH